jgi:arginase family enzyme
MTRFSLLGIPHDDNSSFMKGPAEAPPLIRQKFYCDAYSDCSESGIETATKDRVQGGLTPRRVINWIHQIRQPIVAADIVEYDPRCDVSELTAVVAARLLKEIAGMMLKNARPVDARWK